MNSILSRFAGPSSNPLGYAEDYEGYEPNSLSNKASSSNNVPSFDIPSTDVSIDC